MTKGRDFAREQVIEAIGGSGGIMSAIATRLGCAWDTAKRYVNYWESTKQAFSNERQGFLDACESVLERNVQLAMQAQKKGELADTSDVKWVLARLGKDRGYVERVEQRHAGPDGGPIKTESVNSYGPAEHARAIAALMQALRPIGNPTDGGEQDAVGTAVATPVAGDSELSG